MYFDDTHSLFRSSAQSTDVSPSRCLCLMWQMNLSTFRLISNEAIEFQRLHGPMFRHVHLHLEITYQYDIGGKKVL
jgi:hypothetical protein